MIATIIQHKRLLCAQQSLVPMQGNMLTLKHSGLAIAQSECCQLDFFSSLCGYGG